MLARAPQLSTADAIDAAVAAAKPFPRFPAAFGPRDRSPNVNYTTRQLTDPVAEANRVHARVCARNEELEAVGKGGLR